MTARTRTLPRVLKDECSGDGFEVAWEKTVPYFTRHLARSGRLLLISMVKSRDEGALIEVVPRDGEHGRLVAGLPRLDKIAAAEEGWCISFYRPRADLPTYLHFFDRHLTLVRSASFEMTINAMACLPWGAVVGTRDGLIRGFTPAGGPMWEWELPGARDNHRYAAWNIVAAGDYAVISVMDALYALDPDGVLRWWWRTPLTRSEDELELSAADIASGNTGPGMFDELREVLQRLSESLREKLIESGEELDDEEPPRLAQRHQSGPGERLQGVAYDAGAASDGMAEIAGVGDPYVRWINDGGALIGGQLANSIQSVIAGPQIIAVGDSQSQVHYIAPSDGSTLGRIALEDDENQVRLIADRQRTVRGAITRPFGSSTVFSLDAGEILGKTPIDEHHCAGVAVGQGLLTYTGRDLRGFDPTGKQRWSAQPSILWATAFDDICVFAREQKRLVGLRCVL